MFCEQSLTKTRHCLNHTIYVSFRRKFFFVLLFFPTFPPHAPSLDARGPQLKRSQPRRFKSFHASLSLYSSRFLSFCSACYTERRCSATSKCYDGLGREAHVKNPEKFSVALSGEGGLVYIPAGSLVSFRLVTRTHPY